MILNKVIRKLRPSDYWRIGEHESWFSDMAKEGFHLKRMGLHFAHFVKGEPRNTRYRIDILLNEMTTPEQKHLYSKSGWDYVTSYGIFNIFSSPCELNAPELHTDPAEQSYTLKQLDKKLTINALTVAIATILIIGMIFAIWFFNETPTLALVDGIVIQQAFSAILFLYLAYSSLRATFSIRTLRKTLLDGKPINHNAPWNKMRKGKVIISIIYLIFFGFGSIMLPFVHFTKMETKTLPIVSTDLPIVRLADVEQNPNLVRENSSYMRDNIDWGNRYTYNWSLLAPVQYESDEKGIVPNAMWKDGSGEYSPSIRTEVYELLLPFMAKSLISDLIKRYSLEYRSGDFVEIEPTDFDILIVHEVDGFKGIFASKGRAVMHVRYYGYADIDAIIHSVGEKISLISH